MQAKKLRIGTRASALAQWQAGWVADRLLARGVETERVLISTTGDRRSGPLAALGGSGAFTKELQQALIEDRIDVAVHSLKDLPTDVVPELVLAAVPERAPVWDVLISRGGEMLKDLPNGALVGTGSLRRRAQLLHARPDLRMADLRGNVDTRLRKLREGQYDAIVLAAAGLERLGLAENITQVLPADVALPAVGQGALGIETRAGDRAARDALATLDQPETHAAVLAERAMLAALRGGCLAPVAGWGRVESGRLRLIGRVLSADGRRKIEAEGDAGLAGAVLLGQRVADELLCQGAGELIATARQSA